MNMTQENTKLNENEQKTYDFCIKMGDSHELAMQAVEIERKKAESADFYRFAYEN